MTVIIILNNKSSYVLEGGEKMNKTQMAIVGGIVLAIIVGCIAGGVFN